MKRVARLQIPSPSTRFGVVVSVLMVITFTNGLPAPVSIKPEESSGLFKNINDNFEVVEGPKEFFLPLAPLKSLLAKHEQKKNEKGEGVSTKSSSISGSDLDYMVYGKVYLLKALGISDRSIIGNSGQNSVSLTTTVKPSVTTSKTDGITFQAPTSPRTKRLYQYKYWNTPKPSDYANFSGSSKYQKSVIVKLRASSCRIRISIKGVFKGLNFSNQHSFPFIFFL